MNVIQQDLEGLLLLETAKFEDERGYFAELFQCDRYKLAGMPCQFAQDNLSYSHHGVLRGLHFQNPSAQGKLVTVVAGEVWDVAVDLRRSSKTFKQWRAFTLSATNGKQLWIPEGFAHGFVVTGSHAVVNYKCSSLYVPGTEHTLRWDDEEIGIDWPSTDTRIISKKDMCGKFLCDLEGSLFR